MPPSPLPKRLRIALAIECPLLQHGGVEVLVRAMIKGFADSMDVLLVSQDPPGGPPASALTSEVSGHFSWDPSDHSRGQIDRLIAWGRENRIELFHFHHGGTYSWNSRSWSRCAITEVSRAGFRCVSTNHGAFGFWLFVGAQRSLPYRLAALLLCWPAKLRQIASVEWEATVSQHDYHAVRRWFFPLRSRIRQIYHSVLSEKSLPPANEPPKVILNLATVCSRKGQDILAKAFLNICHDFPNWRLKLVGRIDEPSLANCIRELAKHSGAADRIDLPGPTDTPWEELQNASIFVMPSLSEPLGLSLQEALLAGKACVGSAVGGIPEMISNNHTGLLVPPGKVDDLSTALSKLMTDPQLCSDLGRAGRMKLKEQNMTLEGMLRNHKSLYSQKRGIHRSATQAFRT